MSTNTNTQADTQNNEWKERELGALWVKNGRSGDFLSGHCSVDGQRVEMVVFRNKNKTSDKAPDYILYKSKPMEGNSFVKKTPIQNANASSASEDESDEVPALLQ